MASLEEIEKLLNGETKTIKESFQQDLQKTTLEILTAVNQTLSVHTEKILKLENAVQELNKKEEDRAERELQKDVKERKHNIIFYKIAENETSQDNLLTGMIEMLNEEVESSFEIRDIDFLYRIGKKWEGVIRPILIRFT
ncbi:hypothetical protein ACFFRR_000970 [Megaselia abdita]